MTYLELRAVDPDVFAGMATEFRFVAGQLRDQAERLAELRVRLERGWSGRAARAALDRSGGVYRRLVDAATLAARSDQLLAELADGLERAKVLLTQAERLAAAIGVSIDGQGRADLAGNRLDEIDPTGADVARQIEAALRLARNADRVAADELADLANRVAAGGTDTTAAAAGTDTTAAAGATDTTAAAGYSPSAPLSAPLSAAAGTPVEVAASWSGLTAAQRWWLVTNRPADVGALDGIPAADRDLANRLLLAAERDRLTALRDGSEPPAIEVARIDGQLRGLNAIESRLRDPALARAYLLELSTVDDGRAVIAVGNPDRATDVLTFIPGAGADLSSVDALVARADVMGQAAVRLAPAHRVAVVGWLGYDPPDGVAAAAAWAAHDAEPALDDFVDGLRASHDGEPSHNTVLGHSYGALVAGVTARDRGLDADDLVFVGSAGVGVDRAADLGLPRSAVWSSTAANDPVQRFAPGWGQLARDLVADAITPFSAWFGDPEPDQLLWHGLNPSTPAFGGQVFASDPDGGHAGYWQGAALDAITRIAVNLDPQPSAGELNADRR